MYRVKQQVKARMFVIQDERKKQTFEEVYEYFIKELTFRIKVGMLDGYVKDICRCRPLRDLWITTSNRLFIKTLLRRKRSTSIRYWMGKSSL